MTVLYFTLFPLAHSLPLAFQMKNENARKIFIRLRNEEVPSSICVEALGENKFAQMQSANDFYVVDDDVFLRKLLM